MGQENHSDEDSFNKVMYRETEGDEQRKYRLPNKVFGLSALFKDYMVVGLGSLDSCAWTQDWGEQEIN